MSLVSVILVHGNMGSLCFLIRLWICALRSQRCFLAIWSYGGFMFVEQRKVFFIDQHCPYTPGLRLGRHGGRRLI